MHPPTNVINFFIVHVELKYIIKMMCFLLRENNQSAVFSNQTTL